MSSHAFKKHASGRVRRGFFKAVALGFCSALLAGPLAAQESPEPAPSNLGLLIPSSGVVRPGQGQRVTWRGPAGAQVVALVHLEIGDRRLLILPDGRLVSAPASETTLTEEPFRPATKDELAETLKRTEPFTDFKTRSTAHYLFVYNTSEEFYKGTSRILETMYPAIVAYFKRLKIPVHDPPAPLVAVMFRTEEEFREYEAVAPSIAAYYSSISNHIVMYEQSDLVEVAPELAVKHVIGVIAHEGVHQILHHIGVQQRLSEWPMWISEGLPEYFAPTSVDKRLRWKGVGQPHDLRMYELDKFLKERPGKRGAMVEQVVEAKSLSSSGYAAAWALTHYLASRQRAKFQNYLRDVAQLAPLATRGGVAPDDPKQVFVRYFGADFAAIEDALVEHLKSLPYVDPIANQTHYVVMLRSTTQRSVGITTSPASVRKWQEQALEKIPPQVRSAARFEILPFDNKHLAEQYAEGFLRSN
ncbi:MAG: DUF1570 domain-containing protein [Pirellulales bacterium]